MSDVKKPSWEGHPQYCCERCSSIFALAEIKITLETLKDFTAYAAMESKNGVFRRVMHDCNEGGIGIATLVGACSLETGARLSKAFSERSQSEAPSPPRPGSKSN